MLTTIEKAALRQALTQWRAIKLARHVPGLSPAARAALYNTLQRKHARIVGAL